MTSKNSYWKLSLANIKRRIPYFVICFLICFIVIPVMMYFRAEYYLDDISFYDQKYVISNLMKELTCGGFSQDIITIALAIMLAITGNAWNNSQKKNDFYKSLPIKESTRFVYIHVNSVLGYLACFGVNIILANLVIAGLGLYEGKFVVASFVSIIIHTLEFASVYMLAVIAQYLTGNILLAVCGAAVFCGAEPCIRAILNSLKSVFFQRYLENYYLGMSDIIFKSITTPFAGAVDAFCRIGNKNDDYYAVTNYLTVWPGVLKTLLQIAIYTAIAFYIYTKRTSQNGNKNIVFDKTKPYIKGLIMISVSLACIIIAIVNVTMNLVPGLVAGIVSIIVLHILLQFFIEGDFAAVKKGLISTLVSGVILLGIIGCYWRAGIRFDRYIPKAEEVESIGVSTGNEYYYSFYDDDANHSYIRSSEYFLNDIKITDASYIENVIEIVSKNIENDTYTSDDSVGGDYYCVDVAFNLKNGKQEKRQYIFEYEDYSTIAYATYDQKEYRQATNQLEFENNKKYIHEAKNLSVVYHNFSFSNYDMCAVENKAMQEELIEALSKDHNERTAETYRNDSPIGYTELYAFTGQGMNLSISMPVYECDVNTIEVLKKMDYEPHGLDKSQITKVKILRYSDPDDEGGEIELTPDDTLFETVVDNIILRDCCYNVDIGIKVNNDYDVTIFNKDGNDKNAVLTYAVDFARIDKWMANSK